MANNKPSPEDLSRWLWKDTLESHTTTLVQDALTNNIPERHVTHLLSTKYTQMLWMTGCPISAHAPQRPKGNQMSAISNHNTGANKVSPINERTHGRGNDATPNNDQTLAKVCSPWRFSCLFSSSSCCTHHLHSFCYCVYRDKSISLRRWSLL